MLPLGVLDPAARAETVAVSVIGEPAATELAELVSVTLVAGR